MLPRYFLEFSVGVGVFVIGLSLSCSSPVLFEFISAPVYHGPSCLFTGGTGFCPLQVRPKYVLVLFLKV